MANDADVVSGADVASMDARILLRGTASGLEFIFAAEPGFEQAAAGVLDRLTERPDFYRGSAAAAVFDGAPPEPAAFQAFLAGVYACGIEVRGIYGPDSFAGFAEAHALPYLGAPVRPPVATLEQRREARSVRVVRLSEQAKSLDADFAGARADLARRRKNKGRLARNPVPVPAGNPPVAPVAAAPGAPVTLYHRGTVRGGQSLAQVGNIVVVGDVNPGAELVASGDIVVIGALRGTAHAGAQGDAAARVIALELAPTQLRIATCIAVDDSGRRPHQPEEAYVNHDRIMIAPVGAVPR
ncbi:MAG TPA: septum site-determining protein MinC [Candidatus Acidoferrales bacterium]|nr:septum site-determining protein MinC [Candidatus Acidoferrales bacterium]